MATTSSSFAKKGNVAAYPQEPVAQAVEVQRRKNAELEALVFGIIVPRPRPEDQPKPVLIDGIATWTRSKP
jgi:hypothetical protein